MRRSIRSGLLAALLASVASPSFACETVETCLSRLERGDLGHADKRDLIEDFATLGDDAVGPILERLPVAPETLRQDLVNVLGRMDAPAQGEAIRAVLLTARPELVAAIARIIGPEEAKELHDWRENLASPQAESVRDAVKSSFGMLTGRRILNLALILPVEERADAYRPILSHFDPLSSGAAFRRLAKIDPVDAVSSRDAVMRDITYARHADQAIWSFGPNSRKDPAAYFAWLDELRTDPTMPDIVRATAAAESLNEDNPNPPELQDEFTDWLMRMPLTHFADSSPIPSLYGVAAAPVLTRMWEAGVHREEMLLAFLVLPDPEPWRATLRPMIEDVLRNCWNDHKLVTYALSLKAGLGLTEFNGLVDKITSEHPLDLVTIKHMSNAQDRRMNALVGMGRFRNSSDYCTPSAPLERASRSPILFEEAMRLTASVFPKNIWNPERASFTHISAAMPFRDRLLVGADFGEFGGGLASFNRTDPARDPELLTPSNVQFIAPIRLDDESAFWVMSGLNHMMPAGKILRLDADGLRMHYRVDSEVKQLRRMEDDSLILSFHDEAAEPKRWLSYHPPLRLYPDGRVERACG